ncbi:hypothetical protein NIES2100_48090 [Calothrix sp. NIES-2100]|uniref:hypothetical protein n=1 Tax=Calothrix sp. NIES-2100 TaxID=1954172 RepID=UPI000B5FA871|nr:hypothetical protein NIES2100_48090 [Calothrix sp. NIES-2100]
MERPRIMVIGTNVTTVQRVSRYCLKKGLEVFPYYGIPINDEVSLFDPHILVLCQPIPNELMSSIAQLCISWSEQTIDGYLTLVSSPTELSIPLQEVLQI